MRIQQMFYDDIDRKINGVVKVDQDAADVLKQEVQEYVITRDIRKHIITFFNNYAESFREPTADVGVWISGFFGSGKSHFLKMLSYLLENKEVDGKKVEDYFREKFDDEATLMPSFQKNSPPIWLSSASFAASSGTAPNSVPDGHRYLQNAGTFANPPKRNRDPAPARRNNTTYFPYFKTW